MGAVGAAGAAGGGGSVAVGGGREEGGTCKGRDGTTTSITSDTAGPAPPKPNPTAISVPAPGRGLAEEGMLGNIPGEEEVAGEGIVALSGQDRVWRMSLA